MCCASKFAALALNPSMICVYPLILFLDIPITTPIPQHYEPRGFAFTPSPVISASPVTPLPKHLHPRSPSFC